MKIWDQKAFLLFIYLGFDRYGTCDYFIIPKGWFLNRRSKFRTYIALQRYLRRFFPKVWHRVVRLGLGAILSVLSVLYGLYNSKRKVVLYAIDSLRPAETRYPVNELELLAMMWLERHFKLYLNDENFEIRPDQWPLISLFERTWFWCHLYSESAQLSCRFIEPYVFRLTLKNGKICMSILYRSWQARKLNMLNNKNTSISRCVKVRDRKVLEILEGLTDSVELILW